MLTIIVPCHNEELSVTSTIHEVRDNFSNELIESFIVVDNNSDDATRLFAEECGVKVVSEPTLGKGQAFRRGMTQIGTKSKAVFMIDGDNTYSASAMDLAYSMVTEEGYDMVIGIRREVDSHSYRPGHRFGNWFLTRFHKYVLGSDVKDSLSGWRMMSRGFVLSYSADATRFELETALNAHAAKLKSNVGFVEIDYKGRPLGSHSKLKTFRDGARIIARSLDYWRREKPFKAYSFYALPWFLICLTLLYRVLQDYLITGLVPKIPSLIVSVGFFVIATNLWVAGIILQRTLIIRTELSRYIFLEESRRNSLN